jgi:hypothetical protein
LAIYSHPKYFEKGYKSLFTAAPHLLAGKAHKKEEEEKQERDLAKAKPRRRRRRVVAEAVGIPGLEEARKQSSEQQECHLLPKE